MLWYVLFSKVYLPVLAVLLQIATNKCDDVIRCIASHLLSRHPDARLSNQVTQVPRSGHLHLWDKMSLLLLYVCVCVLLPLWDKMVLLPLCVFVTLRQVGPSPSPRWSWNTFSSGIHTFLEINKQTIDHIIAQDNAFWVNLINDCTNLGTSGQVMVTLTKSHIVDQYQCQLPCWPTQMQPCQHLVQVLVAPQPG